MHIVKLDKLAMNSTCEVLCDARDKQLLERTLCTSLHTQGTYTSPFQIVMFVHHAHGLDYEKQGSFKMNLRSLKKCLVATDANF
jgi:hypothetical protein